MIGGTVSIPVLICPALCIEPNDPARGYIISTLFFVSGIVTFLQTTFGVRYYFAFKLTKYLNKRPFKYYAIKRGGWVR